LNKKLPKIFHNPFNPLTKDSASRGQGMATDITNKQSSQPEEYSLPSASADG